PSFLNASEEVACGSGSWVGRIVVQALHVAGCKMAFDSDQKETVSAPFANNLLMYLLGGKDQYGFPMAGMPMSTNAVGQGARIDMDGEHAAGFFWAPVVDCPGIEEHEDKFPYLCLFRDRFDTNQAGLGKYRGGVGVTEAFTPHNLERMAMVSIGMGDHFTTNYGVFGGYAGPPNPRFVIKGSAVREMMARTDEKLPYGLYELTEGKPMGGEYLLAPSNEAAITYSPGDLFVLVNGSAGGYGDVLERDPEMVMKDLREGLITPSVARQIYCVAWDEETGEADRAKTEVLRVRAREDRKRRGKPFDEFVQEWSKKKPKDEILKYYGNWPMPNDA
ncbi:MAG: hydantoinase B/oxoprolinase family protein, partial [Dehalococcoidia bacterium]|nr:hydantoinase B/oxoprolinase family protein [Dehalococcoidia bacterium]